MSTTIPDLWSDDIRVDILTPLVILRSQESLLSRKTQGMLEAKVTTVANETWVQHQLDLLAPALDYYRVTLLTAKHQRDAVYPVTVAAPCFAPKPGPFSQGPAGSLRFPGGPPPDQREAAGQEEFIELVKQVLRSPEVRAIIQSLIARSNELRGVEPSVNDSKTETNPLPTPESGAEEQ
jgi:hypothetical protein